MTLTHWDLAEIAALTGILVYAWGSPIRFAAVSTVMALITLHGLARVYIGLYGPGVESVIAIGIASGVVGGAHLFFDYSGRGLATGIAFSLVPIFAGFAAKGCLPIVYQHGPGLDFWTLLSLCWWAVCIILFIGIRAERHAVG